MGAVFRKGRSVLWRSAVVVAALVLGAPLVWAEGPRDRAASTGEAAQTQDAATSLRMRGRIEKFETITRVLVLSTATGSEELPVALDARVRQGRHRIDPAALEEWAGYRAAVRYSESAGIKTAESIHVFNK
jgi:hypothetical protein